MTWHLLMLHVTVKDGERALLTRDGKLERVLAPGRHRLFDPRRALAARCCAWSAPNSLPTATRC